MGKTTNKGVNTDASTGASWGVSIAAALVMPFLLSACANTHAKTASAPLPPAPAMDSLSDTPMVTKAPTIKRADPVAAIKTLTKGDDIEIEAPVPVLSATMPSEAPVN